MVVMVMVIISGVVSIKSARKSARSLETIIFGTPFDFNQKKN